MKTKFLMNIHNIIDKSKNFIILAYNKIIGFIKNMFMQKSKINNQTNDNDIHIVKAKVKKIKVKNMKTN